MMKRLATCFIMLAVALSFQAFAQLLHDNSLTRALDLMGFIREYHMVEIQPIKDETADHSQGYGMPFDIMGSGVSYKEDKTRGREIATWTIASTYAPVTIRISATPLKDLGQTTSIDYFLCFRYNYAMFNDAGIASGYNAGYIVVKSDASGGGVEKVLDNVSTGAGDQIYPIISNSQDVRFMLDNYSQDVKESWPGGYYSSTVTIEFVSS